MATTRGCVAISLSEPMVRESKVGKDELETVLATYRQLYQKSRGDAEKAVQVFGAQQPPRSDDVMEGHYPTALDWVKS